MHVNQTASLQNPGLSSFILHSNAYRPANILFLISPRISPLSTNLSTKKRLKNAVCLGEFLYEWITFMRYPHYPQCYPQSPHFFIPMFIPGKYKILASRMLKKSNKKGIDSMKMQSAIPI